MHQQMRKLNRLTMQRIRRHDLRVRYERRQILKKIDFNSSAPANDL